MAPPARQIILGAENAWQVNLLLEMFGEMLCWTLKFLQSLHNSRTRMIATVQLWSCMQQLRLNGGCSAHENNEAFTAIASSYTEQSCLQMSQQSEVEKYFAGQRRLVNLKKQCLDSFCFSPKSGAGL